MSASVPTTRVSSSRDRPWSWISRLGVAIVAFSIQGLHLAVIEDNLKVWWGYGVFFVIVAAVQGGLAVSILFDRPSRRIAVAGIIGNGLLVLLWLITRIGGIPGLFTFEPLSLADTGIATVALELTLIAALVRYYVRPNPHG